MKPVNYENRLFLESNGYLAIPNALSPDEIETLRRAAERAEQTWRQNPSLLGWRNPNLEQIQSIIEYGDEFVDLAANPTIVSVMRDALGDDLALLFTDYFISPPHTSSQIHWHRDARLLGPYHPRSRMLAKAFIPLYDIDPDGGPTAIVPGTHRFDEDWSFPQVDDPAEMPGHIKMAFPAGTIFFTHGRIYHAAMPNSTDTARRLLIFGYGHTWMKPWQGYEPSAALQAKAMNNVQRQLLHLGDPYRNEFDLDSESVETLTPEEAYAQRHKQRPGLGLN